MGTQFILIVRYQQVANFVYRVSLDKLMFFFLGGPITNHNNIIHTKHYFLKRFKSSLYCCRLICIMRVARSLWKESTNSATRCCVLCVCCWWNEWTRNVTHNDTGGWMCEIWTNAVCSCVYIMNNTHIHTYSNRTTWSFAIGATRK